MSHEKLDDRNEPHDVFARQIADHPIEDKGDEKLLARALAEVLAGNGRHPSDDDRYRFDHYTDQTEEPLLALADEPLSRDDVEDLEVGQRRTIFLIAQSVAQSDGGAEPSQAQALARLQSVLDLSAADAMLLEDAGRRHAVENANTIPVGTGDPDEALDRRHEEFRANQVGRVHRRHAPDLASHQVGVFGSTTHSRTDR
ncbi:MAG: hypothetical protein H6701_16455 [Myxococcales bacterium]|nr:hypothetical protein [Myxococcales bacterium]